MNLGYSALLVEREDVAAQHVHLTTAPLADDERNAHDHVAAGHDVDHLHAPIVEWLHAAAHVVGHHRHAAVRTGHRVIAGDVPDSVIGKHRRAGRVVECAERVEATDHGDVLRNPHV